MLPPLLLLLLPNPVSVAAPALAAKVDALVAKHWQENQIQPAAPADDATFLRRLTLDLAGRIPTPGEADAFRAERSPRKRARAVRRLMEGPEYALHLGRVLDSLIQGKYAGDPDFLDYLRASAAAHKPWDRLFREILLGPWDAPGRRAADRFLLKRVRNLDDLTNDTARVFFGVNVSCAKCHDHPLVPDWTQDHYYGMASFFNRTRPAPRKKGAKVAAGEVTEQTSGEVMFVTTKGERRTARMMFLSSRVIEDAKSQAKGLSRREQLVKVALEEKRFFSRAVVNHLWAYFLGRGLVHPVDQMHSANPPSVAGVLEVLADDLAAHVYDLDRLIAGIVSSKVYKLASAGSRAGEEAPAEKHFARALLRPLTPEQYALSILVAVGDGPFDAARRRALEGQTAVLTRPQLLDAPSDRFQSSAGEALFMSNHAEVQRLVQPAGNNLTARLAKIGAVGQLVDTAVGTVLGRPPEPQERAYLMQWVERQKQERAKTCGELVWALVTSAEFRFNH
jgi:hypothetical protein